MSKVTDMRPTLSLTVATLLLGALLAGCGEDKPAVCTSVNDLKTSVGDVKDVDLTSSGALADLKTSLEKVQGDLADVKSDAKSEFSSQISAVDTTYEALKTAVEAAVADPSADTLTAAVAALSAFGTDAETLVDDIQSTC